MELIKLAGIMGASGASFASGSMLSDTSLHLFPGSVTHSGSSVPPGKRFQDFDLSCVHSWNWYNNRQIFWSLSDYSLLPKLKEPINAGLSLSSYNLNAPSTVTGEVKGCLRTTFSRSDQKMVGVTMELALSKDKYGIILMNTIANIKDNGGKKSVFRALFLETKDNRWEINSGIEWSDEDFFKDAKKLSWSGLSERTEEINLEEGFTNSTSLEKDPFSLSWKKGESPDKNVYQHLTLTKTDPSSANPKKPTDFWNGNQEPLATNTTLKPTAVFMDGVWIKPPTTSPDVSKVKDWFNLFKEDKGTWEA